MSIFRSNNPADFDDVDGIIIDETAPAPNISGSPSNIALMVAQFQRGLQSLVEVGSIGELHEQFGKSSYSGNQQLKNKKFGRLRVIRVVASDGVVAKEEFASSAVDRIRFTAKQGVGVYGNSIQVKIEAGSSSGKKYTIKDTSTDAVLPQEVYDNIVISAITADTFAASKLITATVLSSAAEPDNAAFTALAGGSDGTVADGDYEDAIALAAVERAGNFLFLDVYNSTRNGYLELHAAETQDKMVILAGPEVQTRADVVTDVASYRDSDGRIIYAWPWVETVISGVKVMTSPASWYASILSQTSPHIDPAYAANTQFLGGITSLKYQPSRADYIALKDAGVSAFEYDSDIGFKIKSGVVTQIANSSKVTVLRRRMADYLTDSVAKFLKNFQNAPNSKSNRTLVKGAIIKFIQDQESLAILPKDSEVKSGKAKIVDTESLNTDDSIAAGFFKILYKQRIFSSMRYIVLQAEIGESVVVTESE